MMKLLLIGVGGFAGALLRYSVSGLVQNISTAVAFPYGTLVVNLLGCLLIGGLSQIVESQGVVSPEIQSFMFIGFLGAFTTFSTFGNESFLLLSQGKSHLTLVNVGFHLILGIGSVWVGRVVVGSIWK